VTEKEPYFFLCCIATNIDTEIVMDGGSINKVEKTEVLLVVTWL